MPNIEPLADKLTSFGFDVRECNGHSMAEVVEALEAVQSVEGKPQAVIAHTIKGAGVSFMEGNNDFHGVAPTPEQAEAALAEVA